MITLTPCLPELHGPVLALTPGTFAVEQGPHGGAVILYNGQRIGVVESVSDVMTKVESAR